MRIGLWKHQITSSPLPVGRDTNSGSQPFTSSILPLVVALYIHTFTALIRISQTDILVVVAYSAYSGTRSRCQNDRIHITKQL